MMKHKCPHMAGLIGLLILTGCHSGHMGNPTLINTTRTLRTRDEVLRTLGGPTAVNVKDGNQFLTYAYTRTRGGGLGAGFIGIGLFISSDNIGSDTVTFLIDPDGRVLERRVGEHATASLGPGIWPF